MSDAFEALIAPVLAVEGGYTNNPNDPGGPTNFGVTEATARANGYMGDMAAMTQADAVGIYRAVYWEKSGFSAIYNVSPPIAAKLLNAGVNVGVAIESLFLQRALNVLGRAALTLDAHIGPATVAALQAYLTDRPTDGEAIMLKALNGLQCARYITLAEANADLAQFVNGWLKQRID